MIRVISNDSGSRYATSVEFLRAEEKSQRLCKWFTIFIFVIFTFGVIVVPLVMSMWCMYIGNFDSETWFLAYVIKLPIDKSSVIGWYCEYLLQAYSGYAFLFTITFTVTLFGGCSFYIEACLMQIKHMFANIDAHAHIENSAANKMIERKIFETIIFHNKIIVVYDTVAEVYSVAIFFHLISNVLFFAGAIYQTEMVFIALFCCQILNTSFEFVVNLFIFISTFKTIDEIGLALFFNVMCIIEGLSYTFILCYFAEVSSSSMTEIANVVYHSNWYVQCPKMQRLLVLIVARAQKSNEFKGLGLIHCSLESFMKVGFEMRLETRNI